MRYSLHRKQCNVTVVITKNINANVCVHFKILVYKGIEIANRPLFYNHLALTKFWIKREQQKNRWTA